MKVQCHHCSKKYTLPPERVAGRILKIRCRQCSNLFEVDGSQIVLTEINAKHDDSSSPNKQSTSGVSVQLRTQELSAIELPVKPVQMASHLTQSTPDTKSDSSLTATLTRGSQSTAAKFEKPLSVEVSQSAQEWMESVMSDVDRPITREIKLGEITGHRSLPPEKRSSNLVWLFAIIIVLGLGYLVTQIGSPTRSKPKVLSLNLKTNTSLSNASGDSNSAVGFVPSEKASIETSDIKEPTELKQESQKLVSPKKGTGKKKKKSSKAGLKDLNQALSDLKKSKLSTSSPSKIEIEGNLEGARKRNTLSAKSSTKKSKSKATLSLDTSKKKARSKAKRQSKKSKDTKKSALRMKQAKKTKYSKPSKKKTSSKRSGKGLDRSTVSTIMNQNSSGLENCYRKALKKDSSFGEVRTRLKFRVSPNGRVNRKTISLSGVYRRTRLESCIQNTVVRWYFPKAAGETPVKYPLNFTPGF